MYSIKDIREARHALATVLVVDRSVSFVFDPSKIRGYFTPAGTTLMLLNGDPLISFVLTTV